MVDTVVMVVAVLAIKVQAPANEHPAAMLSILMPSVVLPYGLRVSHCSSVVGAHA